jgi:hypothetical protein
MARRTPPRKVTYFEPVPPRLAGNIIIESTFEVGHRFRCTMRRRLRQLDPGAVIRPVPEEWHPRMPARLDEHLRGCPRQRDGQSAHALEDPPARVSPRVRRSVSGAYRASLTIGELSCDGAHCPVDPPAQSRHPSPESQVCKDSPLEGGGFEPSVPRRGPSPSWPLNLLRP